jgi:hypothetical protein
MGMVIMMMVSPIRMKSCFSITIVGVGLVNGTQVTSAIPTNFPAVTISRDFYISLVIVSAFVAPTSRRPMVVFAYSFPVSGDVFRLF